MWMVRGLAVLLLGLTGILVVQSCSSASGTGAGAKSKAVPNPTFNQNIGPLVQAKCMQCHSPGAIEAAVQFNTYTGAKMWATSISNEINSRTMPPWPLASGNSKYAPGNAMPGYQDTRGLTDDEIDMLNTWIQNSMPEGDGGTTTFQPPATDTLSGPNVVTVKMPQPFTPNPGAGALDQYRCFIINPISTTSNSWVTAYQMQPDQSAETHHAIIFVPLTPADMQAAKALETVPGQGYDCLTGPGANVNTQILALWAPGTNVIRYPNNTAIVVPAGMGMILQIHYNIRGGATADQSSILVDAQPTSAGLTQAYWIPAGLGVPDNTTIPLNQADAQFPLTQTVQKIFGGANSVAIYGIYPHQHRLGTRLHGEFQHGGTGPLLPLFDDYPWDFNWQNGYFFANTINLAGSDTVTVTCHYDTTLDSNGNDITGTHRTVPVPFGDFTTDEMCFGFLYGVILQ